MLENNNEMISVEEAAKRLGTHPDNLRDQIVRKKTPFKTWCMKTSSGARRFFIPRRSFEQWLCGDDVVADNTQSKNYCQ